MNFLRAQNSGGQEQIGLQVENPNFLYELFFIWPKKS